MADGADPHRATGAPPRPRRWTPLREGECLTVASIGNRFTMLPDLDLEEEEDEAAGPDPAPPLRDLEDVVAGPDPAPHADVAGRRRRPRRHRLRLRRFGTGSQSSSSAAPTMDGGARDPGPSSAPSSDHPGALGRTRVRQSVLYSDRPRHSRPRRLARAEASVVVSSEVHSPVMDLPTFELLSSGDPSLSTPETAEITNVNYAPRAGQEERTCVVNSSEVNREGIEALPLSDPPLLTPQPETDEESTDDDCAWVPPPRQTRCFINRPTGISLSMVLSKPLIRIIPNVKEQRPKPYSDIDPKDVQRMVKEYLDGRPCINLDVAPDSILAIEEALDARAAELGTEPQLPGVITESRHEASAEEIIPNGTAWMNEEVMLCFKKYIAIARHLMNLEDYGLDELQHQCFNVESYGKVYHHYNFTVRMKMPEADWKVKLYFAEVKEVFGKKYYLCYPLDPNENGQCYACKNQGVEDLRHPAFELYEMGSLDASCNLWYTDDESDEEPKATRFESDSFDLEVLFGSF